MFPKDINDFILFQIDKTNRKAKTSSQKEFDHLKLGITVEQWILLKIIEESEMLSQKVLAERSLRDPASITRTLDLLERKGLVEREPLPDNRRQYNINLSPEGKQFVQKHSATVQKLRNRSTAGFTPRELEQLRRMLLRIQDNLE